MRITFLMPCYIWAPSGGARVVYEYANRLASRGHQVTVVHPLRLRFNPRDKVTAYEWVRDKAEWLRGRVWEPHIDWQPIDKKVAVRFVPTSDTRYIPDGDAIFATSWHTVASVRQYPEAKGEKCYLIQHYEVWQGRKEFVDATWRSDLHKVVIAKWLKELGEELGCRDVTYIPNAINHDLYRPTRPIEDRPRQVAMMFSPVKFKGSADGIRALEITKQRFPDLKAVFFSTSRFQGEIPDWIECHRNPSQEFLVNTLLNGSSVFLSPSLSEGSPLPPAEAAACGCAIVSTSNRGVQEYIEHGVSGLLSPPGEPEKLAENLCGLLENDSVRVQLAKAGLGKVSLLSWEKSTDLLESLLKNVTNGNCGQV
jgi:glycosyltransferase involved in cell wall biosynthesis